MSDRFDQGFHNVVFAESLAVVGWTKRRVSAIFKDGYFWQADTEQTRWRIWGNMKKYVLFGLIAGVTISVLAVYFRRKKLAGTEFYGFFDSSTVADELFGDAFEELPDKP